MAEGNSCYRGGKAGMSNALAGALWGIDYMLDMAARGCQGINFHGGGGSVISSALGDKLPGARDARDLEIARLGTFYSPIAGNRDEGYSARPLFHAMKAVELLTDANLVGTEFDTAARMPRPTQRRSKAGWRLALVNKDASRDLTVDLELPRDVPRDGHLWRLTGPALEAIDGIELVDGVGPLATWTCAVSNCRAPVPRSSASVESEGCMKKLFLARRSVARSHSRLRSAALGCGNHLTQGRAQTRLARRRLAARRAWAPRTASRKFAEETANPRSWQQGAFWVGMTHLADVSGEKRFAEAILAMGRANQWQPGQRTYHADDHVIGQSYLWAARNGAGTEAIAPLRATFDSILAKPPVAHLSFVVAKDYESTRLPAPLVLVRRAVHVAAGVG